MMEHEATLQRRSVDWLPRGDLRLIYSAAGVCPADGFNHSNGLGWPDEPVSETTLAMDQCIPRIEGGRPLPSSLRNAVIALGNFDGFHIGHQAVVGRAVEMARSRGVAAVIATFDPHPRCHFAPNVATFHLTTLDQRQQLFAEAGADAMMLFHFNGALANVLPQHFIQHWLAGASGVVTGDGFRFGRERTGTARMFYELAAVEGITYEAVTPVSLDNGCVSSTRIRNALKLGDCSTAQRLLSRPFTICGSLQLHNRMGRESGLPLASISAEGYMRPRHGSYAVVVRLSDGRRLHCSADINRTTTVAPEQGLVWLAGRCLQDDLQGQAVKVEFVARLPDIEVAAFLD